MKKNVTAIGIDIGGTDTKICLVNNEGQISELQRVPTRVKAENPDLFFEEIKQVSRRILPAAGSEVIGAGVSCLGLQNEDGSGPYLSVNVPALNNFDIRKALQDKLNLPVSVTNDLMSHTLAEYYFGCGKGSQRFLCVALGTGIGAAAVIHGEALKIWGGTSGDNGRIVLEPQSELICGGRVRGSAEALCGVAGIEAYARELYKKENIRARDVISACRDTNDPLARQVIQKVGEHTGHLLSILSMIFSPNRIALAGGTTNAGPVLLDACRERFDTICGSFFEMLAEASPENHHKVDIRFGEIKGEAGVVGGTIEILKPYIRNLDQK